MISQNNNQSSEEKRPMTVNTKVFINTPKKIDPMKSEKDKYDDEEFGFSPATIKK